MANAHTRDFFDQVQYLTESFLNKRREKQILKKEKHLQKIEKYRNKINSKVKEPWLQVTLVTAIDWIEAFLWAACVVLLINQYLFQLYQIPSESMVDTLVVKDRVFVNKIVYGPELLPGFAKLPSPIKPKRNDVIIFENPDYISRGVAFDVAQRVLFMLTLSLVDIDKDESGAPEHHFLIKRAVGVPGDRFVNERGNLNILFAGENEWVRESDFNRSRNFSHNVKRELKEVDYPAIEAVGKVLAYGEIGLHSPEYLTSRLTENSEIYARIDSKTSGRSRYEVLNAAYPHNERYGILLAQEIQGRYVPQGRILPLGDNRDNSRDGRYFGPVKESKILGKAVAKFNFDFSAFKFSAGVIK